MRDPRQSQIKEFHLFVWKGLFKLCCPVYPHKTQTRWKSINIGDIQAPGPISKPKASQAKRGRPSNVLVKELNES